MKKVVTKGRTVEEAISLALKELDTSRENVETKVLELPSGGIMGLFRNRYAKVEVIINTDLCKIAKTYLNNIVSAMGIEANIETSLDENVLSIVMTGQDMGILIGRRGQTLDSLQYLTSLVINKLTEQYVRVVLDTENYRKKRELTLKDLAEKLAHRVISTKKKIELEPMNPYERRIIHATLQKNNKIYTFSQGEEPFRKVVIDIKKTS
ncbi:KH domain-containing protein [Alkalibaculum sp. M08DMB]|uniref:RNA-binding protein KhpB n=1 Tax=Alkalibaculum sporogenes TaxID=2655001 RepID=A0A6A7K7J7_9FIRM|nr:RNA-binding cell elongation regulator Jag/EloR [Alkalibaculum sporogenes]MPW25312.1 KH domain-containing protein [Alkalibaculum sporogenes]